MTKLSQFPMPKRSTPSSAFARMAVAFTAFSLVACQVEDEGDELSDSSDAVVLGQTPIAPDLNAGSKNKLGEVSGLAASAQYPGFIWMHRDGYAADRPSREFLYAMKIVDRKLVPFTGSSGTYPTREFSFGSGLSVENINWEDMAAGPDVRGGAGQSLYVGDIGNNNGGRNSYQIYQVPEPNPTGASSVIGSLQATWKFAYPTSAKLSNGEYPNCEVMFYLDRMLYILTKESSPRVYRFPSDFATKPGTLQTLVQVTNGGVDRVVGAIGNPSYAGFSSDRTRFVLGGHETFGVYTLASSGLTGDALVRAMLLTSGHPPAFKHDVADPAKYPKLNAEGATFEAGTRNVVIGTESKMVFHWPSASIEK